MADKLEVGDRAPNFELPAVYGYKPGATSPSAEEGVSHQAQRVEGKKWVILAFYVFDASPEDTRSMVCFNEWNRKFRTKEVELFGISWNGCNPTVSSPKSTNSDLPCWPTSIKRSPILYGVIEEVDDLGQMVKRIHRTTFVIDKTGMIRAIWDNIEDLREHPREVWEFIQKEKAGK